MVDVFSKLGESLKSTLKEAGAQTQKSVDQMTLRSEMINKKAELKKLYQILGETIYNSYSESQIATEQSELFNRITLLKKSMEEIDKKIEDIVSTQKGSFNAYKEEVKTKWTAEEDVSYSKMPSQTVTVQEIKVCPICHTGNNEYAAYCMNCGNKLN